MSISDQGKLEALERKGRTVKKLLDVMKSIESEIDNNSGLYAYNGGRISQQEVLRRAGLSSAVLQKKTHDHLRNEVNAWIRAVSKKAIIGARSVRRSVTERVEAVRTDMDQLMQQWTEAELEYIDARGAMAKKDARILELEQETERLRRAVSGGSVIGFPAISERKDSRRRPEASSGGRS